LQCVTSDCLEDDLKSIFELELRLKKSTLLLQSSGGALDDGGMKIEAQIQRLQCVIQHKVLLKKAITLDAEYLTLPARQKLSFAIDSLQIYLQQQKSLSSVPSFNSNLNCINTVLKYLSTFSWCSTETFQRNSELLSILDELSYLIHPLPTKSIVSSVCVRYH
jgi:hypothetical protein